jgi:two-component system, LytTR family, sensor kinase
MNFARYNDKWLRLIGIPLIGLSMPFLFGPQRSISDTRFWLALLLSTLMTFIIWEGNRRIILWLRRFVSWERSPYARLIEQASLTVIFTVVTVLMLYLLFIPVLGLPPSGLGNTLLASVSLTIFFNAVYESLYFTSRWRYAFMRAEVLKRENLHSQFESMKNRVNPRFLFNSLNTLSSLIDRDRQRAVEFVQDMARVYRYTLQSKEWPLVMLKKELGFLEIYIHLLKERFGNSLDIDIEIPDDAMTASIPPLTLQFLIENAIRHNEASLQHPLHIHLAVKDAELHVSNNLQRKAEAQRSPRMGVEEIQARYRIFTEKKIRIQEDKDYFRIELPLLREE